MKLSQEDAREFYAVWLGLLSYVNDKHGISATFGHPHVPAGIALADVAPVRDRLWEDDGVIDEYIESRWDMPRQETAILKGWKNKVMGTFFILRHLKKYSIWINESDSVYGVVGISEPVSETLSAFPCPMAVKAVLIPFKNQIIYDSLLVPYNVRFGGNIRKQMNEVYSTAKESKSILTAL